MNDIYIVEDPDGKKIECAVPISFSTVVTFPGYKEKRYPGGRLFRKKRLIKKHNKWEAQIHRAVLSAKRAMDRQISKSICGSVN